MRVLGEPSGEWGMISGVSVPYGDVEAYVRAARRAGGEGEGGTDEQGAFAHAAQTRALVSVPQAAAVVADAQLHPARAAAQGEFEQGRPGVPDRVGERLLGDAVDDEFRLLPERWQVLLHPPPDRQSPGRRRLGGQRREGADQPELLQHPG